MASHGGSLTTPLRLAPARSRPLLVFLLLGCSLAAISLLVLPQHFAWKALGILVLGVMLYRYYRCHLKRSAPGAIRSAVWDEQGNWQLDLADGSRVDAVLLPDSFLTVHLVILNFRIDGMRRSRSLILTGDSVHPDLLRRLRVRLRLTYKEAG